MFESSIRCWVRVPSCAQSVADQSWRLKGRNLNYRMQLVRQVSQPPAKPLMIFDGDCGFCRRWIVRFKRWTSPHVEFLPAQDSSIAMRFPEIPREQFDLAVQLIASDGSVFSGAEAVFRALDSAARASWLLRAYQRFPVFARLAEWIYRFIARHRRFFSKI